MSGSPRPFWVPVERDAVRISGPDARSYMQSQLSQDISGLEVGESAWSLILQPNGKVDSLVRVLATGDDELVVDVDGGYGAAVHARLERFRIRVQAVLEPVPWAALAVRGMRGTRPSPEPPTWAAPAWGDPALGFDLLGPSPTPPEGIARGDDEELEAARIAAGWPALGWEITEDTIPAELGPLVDLTVSFTKGCYPGQELVERMSSRGAAAPRQLRRLGVDVPIAAVLTAGQALWSHGRDVGRVTSASSGSGLAVVHRSVEVGDEVEVDVGVGIEVGVGVPGEAARVVARVLPLR